MENSVKSSGQDLLIPREKVNKRKQRSVLVEINSRDRNVVSYPNPNTFRWLLQRPLKDIQSIQIVGGSFPLRVFNIYTGFNSFTFFQGTDRFNITLTPGRYSLGDLAVEVAAQINTATGFKNTYSVSFSATSDQMTITQDNGPKTPFGFLFATGDYQDLYQNGVLLQINSAAKLLGFANQDYSDNGTRAITSPFGADVDVMINRLYLYINVDTSQDLTTIERSVGKRDPFSILYMDQNLHAYKYFDKVTFEPCYLSSPAPVARIRSFDVSVRDEFYRLVDMNGHDFTLLLEVVTLE